MTTSEELQQLSERELLIKVTVAQEYMKSDITELKVHSETNNGIVADLVKAKNFTYGALTMLVLIMTLGVPIVAMVWNQL